MSQSYFQPEVERSGRGHFPIQMRSDTDQKPFFFGASFVPVSLMMSPNEYSGGKIQNVNAGFELGKEGTGVFHKKHSKVMLPHTIR